MTTLAPMNVPQLLEGLVQKYGSINRAAIGCGMSQSHFWMLYTGKRREPTLSTLRMIAHGYGQPVSEIVAMLDAEDVRTAPGA